MHDWRDAQEEEEEEKKSMTIKDGDAVHFEDISPFVHRSLCKIPNENNYHENHLRKRTNDAST